MRTTGGGSTGSVRNLRIREDTAKYLLNLDPKSAHYDPKSRSMRADPNPDKASHEKTFAGDNALRTTGDEFEFWQRVTEHTVLEGEKGSAAHLQARSQLLLHVQCLCIAPSASATGAACCCSFGACVLRCACLSVASGCTERAARVDPASRCVPIAVRPLSGRMRSASSGPWRGPRGYVGAAAGCAHNAL